MDPKRAYWGGPGKWLEAPSEGGLKGGEILVHEPDILKTESNRIYFYSDIGRESVLKLNHKLRDMGTSYIAEQVYRGVEHPTPLYLHINSYGGSIFHGLSAMDSVLTSLLPIYSVVDGCCASAATFMSVAADKRLMQANAYMMIHQLSSVIWGKFTDFKDGMQNLEALMAKIKDIYREYTEVPSDKLDELLTHDLWWDAEQCLEYGMIDEIVQGRRRS